MKRRHPRCLALTALVLLATSALLDAQVGAVRDALKIEEGALGFAGPLDDLDLFGVSVAGVGDLDGDGVPDLAVGARYDDDGGPQRGAVWILFLAPSGRVQRQAKISATQGGFTGSLSDGAGFGQRIAAVGDLDGDGIGELAVRSGGCAPGLQRPRLWILFLRADGTVRTHTEMLFTDPAFAPAPLACDFEDGDLVALGDVDGDGLGDLALGAPNDDDGPGADRGALWIVRLNADGTPKSTQKISSLFGGLTAELPVGGHFGGAIANLGDLDGDGNVELAANVPFEIPILFLDANQRVRQEESLSAFDFGLTTGNQVSGPGPIVGLGDLDGDGLAEIAFAAPASLGAIGVGFLAGDGSLRKRLLADPGVFGPSDPGLGRATPLGDLDGDGGLELAVGAPADGVAGDRPGAVWILFTRPTPVRNGSRVNPLTLKPGDDAVLGTSWRVALDCSAHGAGLALLDGRSEAQSGLFAPAGELLVGGQRLFRRVVAHAGTESVFQEPLPDDLALVNLEVHVQGLCTGAPGPQLSNALDFLVGN